MNLRLAGCIVRDGQDRVLLLHRHTAKRVQWEIPGGKVEHGESPADAAKREAQEELGIDVELQTILGEKTFTEDGTTMHYIWFLARILSGKPKIMEPETFDDMHYFSVEDMRAIYNELSPNTKNFLGSLSE